MHSIKNLNTPSSTGSKNLTNEFHSLSCLEDFVYTYRHGCLVVHSKSLSWWIYLKDGKFSYACHGSKKSIVYSLNRLKLELRNINAQAYLRLESNIDRLLNYEINRIQSVQYVEYQIVSWLVEQRYITIEQAENLTEKLARETIESLLKITDGIAKIDYKSPAISAFCSLEPNTVIKRCQARVESWKTLSPLILSPHQRPYIVNQNVFYRANDRDVISPRLKSKLAPILRGYSIRHIGALLQHDELEIAKLLYPYIDNGSIVLRAPEPPFEQLCKVEPATSKPSQSLTSKAVFQNGSSASTQTNTRNGKQNSHVIIACVDDSPNTLNQIERFLDQENFLIFKFSEPVKATFQLRSIKPDIILLDLTMPKISGYELCQMLRNLPGFKKIPVVMVTGKKGVVDKARAKLVGATDYLEKPFTRDSLLNMISRNLT
ncbi:MAG: response regulator [Cyanobacteria bacterium P01_F01_bin.86]